MMRISAIEYKCEDPTSGPVSQGMQNNMINEKLDKKEFKKDTKKKPPIEKDDKVLFTHLKQKRSIRLAKINRL